MSARDYTSAREIFYYTGQFKTYTFAVKIWIYTPSIKIYTQPWKIHFYTPDAKILADLGAQAGSQAFGVAKIVTLHPERRLFALI